MAQPSSILLLASLPLLFPPATPSGLHLPPELPPPAPNISVSPAKAQFLIGDAVSIACAAPASPGTDRVQGFRFSGSAGWVSDVRTSRRAAVHSFTVAGPRDGGVHTCSYSVVRRGRGVLHSLASAAVLIDVRDRPSPPNLTVTPSALTVEGQPLLFLCAAPPGPAPPRRFRFLREELEVAREAPEGSGSVRLRVERSGRNQTGNFSCGYEEMTEGRWIASYPSRAVRVLVEEPCPAPVLWAEPPSGVVAAGHRLRLTCSAPPRRFRRRFRFFRDGAELPGDVSGDVSGDISGDVIGDGSALLFPRISPEFSGNFSCLLEEEVGGAWVEAPPSKGMAVVVVGDFSPPAEFEFLPLVIGGVVGVALLLLVIPLAVWLCRRRRGGSRWRGLSPGDDTGTLRMGDLEVAS